MSNWNYTTDWAYVNGLPTASARIRTTAEDFQVNELLNFEPTDAGEHVLLQIRKRHLNTEWLAGHLAHCFQVNRQQVGYAGLKDRHALTCQWFSIHLPPIQPHLEHDDFEVLQLRRHCCKLRRRHMKANQFELVLRQLQDEHAELAPRLHAIAENGVPNYFGHQRFGHEGNNLAQAAAMLAGTKRVRSRHLRGLYLSAARALLFNQVLSQRVKQGFWHQAVAGDVMLLVDNQLAVFETLTSELEQQVKQFYCHPTGPLWGRGRTPAKLQAADLETQVLSAYAPWCDALEHSGLQQDRRALRLWVAEFNWQFWDQHTLKLKFTLPAGGYATTVLRELIQTDEHPL
ncbi:MAG: tRNA pseudouridine(13) synthase TruD [Pseudomonadota bacterium]|nr:tRNA pseudouridine(13) synthase TruD [Pseudomonadota bacterium]